MRGIVVLVVSCLSVPVSARAQSAAAPAPGARVRLTLREGTSCPTSAAAGSRVVGIFGGAGLEGIGLVPDSGAGSADAPVFPWEAVCGVETRNSRRRPLAGAVVGLGAGAVLGFAAGSFADWIGDCEAGDPGCPSASMTGLAVGGAAGALLGAGIGALVRVKGWQEIPLERLRVAITPCVDGGVGVAGRAAF